MSHGYPKPDNFEAMCRAAHDPVLFAVELKIYDQQLAAAGLMPPERVELDIEQLTRFEKRADLI